MKKIIALTFAIILPLTLAACMRSGATTESGMNATPKSNESTPTAYEKPHPFAAALVDFNENIDEGFYDSFRDLADYIISHTSAYIIDLDGNGTAGVLAYRAVGDVDHFRVIYMQDGEIKTLDFAGHFFYLNEVGEAPLITLGGGEGAGRLYDIYSMTPEGLAVTTKLWDFLGNEFYYNDEQVSEEEFEILLERYNINDNRFIIFARKPRGGYLDEVLNARPDDTAEILSAKIMEFSLLETDWTHDSIIGSWETAVYVDEEEFILRVEADKNGDLFFDLYGFMEQLGYGVHLIPGTSYFEMKNNENLIRVFAWSKKCEKNGESIELDALTYIQNHYPYFHQSFITKVLCMEISYVDRADNGSDRVNGVFISSKSD